MDRPRTRVRVDLRVESVMLDQERQRHHQFAICNGRPRRNRRSRKNNRDRAISSDAWADCHPALTEVSKKWPTRAVEINTPLAAMRGASLARPLVFAPILRAGLGLLEGMLRVMPDAEIGHIGLYRD